MTKITINNIVQVNYCKNVTETKRSFALTREKVKIQKKKIIHNNSNTDKICRQLENGNGKGFKFTTSFQ